MFYMVMFKITISYFLKAYDHICIYLSTLTLYHGFSVLFMYYWEMLTRNQSKEKFERCIPIYRINNCFIYIKAELRVLINGMSNKL